MQSGYHASEEDARRVSASAFPSIQSYDPSNNASSSSFLHPAIDLNSAVSSFASFGAAVHLNPDLLDIAAGGRDELVSSWARSPLLTNERSHPPPEQPPRRTAFHHRSACYR